MPVQKIECHAKKHEGPKLVAVSGFRGWDLKHRHYAVCRACRMLAEAAHRRPTPQPIGAAWRGTNGLFFEKRAA